MKGKSILFSILTFALGIIGIVSPSFSAIAQLWLGVLAIAITMFVQVVMPTGTLPIGWTVTMWGFNIGGIVVMVLGYMGKQELISVALATLLTGIINLFITTFLKDYGNGSVLSGKRLNGI